MTTIILQFIDLYHTKLNVDAVRCILALNTLLMWTKLLYILRIFKHTGYLIRMIIVVIWDMGIFLFIYFVTIIAFGDSFLRLSLGNPPDV